MVGIQWGDEGKGKIVDAFSASADVVVRYQGGSNAGHTIGAAEELLLLHLVPSAVLHSPTLCVLADGIAVDPEKLFDELDFLEAAGCDVGPSRLQVSLNAHVVMPYHRRLDIGRQSNTSNIDIGTTCQGIGPCLEDKASRRGLRVQDLTHPFMLRERLSTRIQEANAQLRVYGCEPVDLESLIEWCLIAGSHLKPYAKNVTRTVREALAHHGVVLFEGAQGTMLDVDHGTYPYVTASNTIAAYAAVSVGLGPRSVDMVIGIAKAYTTRVSHGPFPTEVEGSTAQHLRGGSDMPTISTYRAIRCGWLDAVALRYAVETNGVSCLALTCLDVLTGLDSLHLATAYCFPDGGSSDSFPLDAKAQHDALPRYEAMEGWTAPITEVRTFADLPVEARRYVQRVEELIGVPVIVISVGPRREQTIVRHNPLVPMSQAALLQARMSWD